MELTINVMREIAMNYGGLPTFIGEKIRREYGEQIDFCFKLVNRIEQAAVLIERNVVDFCTRIVITDSTNIYPTNYKVEQVDKTAGVTAYIRRALGRENLYRLNPNSELFSMVLSRDIGKASESISDTFGRYGAKRLLIMGSGPSSAAIEYDRIAKDVDIMVINYNFSMPADWHFYHDQRVANDLNAVAFKNKRKIIGPSNRPCLIRDYHYVEDKDCVKVGHSGAVCLQLGQKMGYAEIYLAGYDYTQTADGKDHPYREKENGLYKNEKHMKGFLEDFGKFNVAGNVHNLNNRSALRAIKFANKESVYAN